MAVASIGGHWIQLLRLRPVFEGQDVVFVSTKASFASMVSNCKFYTIPDGSRKNPINLLLSFKVLFKILRQEKPEAILSTGAAPGLLALLCGKILGKKTIWVDSVANVEKLSMSGILASKFATHVYTQWPDLAQGTIKYAGSVLAKEQKQ
ncbi:Oligosaccharide biosynthesis protein Alg14 like [Leeuwenhoekiella marinoflava DSM 3653]|uniref:Oligosaccharide biosynthesis protein Alg14 like n=2 Tax=Leeuwenhoekiella marinoflava TaxID=988 RepID=A0ABY1HXY6_9FLAO|nr:Oligosaccharide biosynthesis protein Alg14 like [Leeuwenhoekiella marinoflava DSM 3653]